MTTLYEMLYAMNIQTVTGCPHCNTYTKLSKTEVAVNMLEETGCFELIRKGKCPKCHGIVEHIQPLKLQAPKVACRNPKPALKANFRRMREEILRAKRTGKL